MDLFVCRLGFRGRFRVCTVGPPKYTSVIDHTRVGVGVSSWVNFVVACSIDTPCHWVIEGH